MITQSLGGIRAPESFAQKPTQVDKKPEPGQKDSVGEFEKILTESQKVIEEDRNKTKVQGKEMVFGESKSDKDFRETLQKITGKDLNKPKNKMDKDDYLTLMMTQLKYQDPSKPMENHEMANQMAQMNTVEQLVGIHKTLEKVLASKEGSAIDKLSPYLGKEIRIESKSINLGDEPPKILVDIPDNVGSFAFSIKNSKGEVVKNLSLKSLDSGLKSLVWDGKDENGVVCPKGKYDFKIDATSQDGKSLSLTAQVSASVTGISDLDKGGVLLTNQGKRSIGEIQSISQQDSQVIQKEPEKSKEPIKQPIKETLKNYSALGGNHGNS